MIGKKRRVLALVPRCPYLGNMRSLASLFIASLLMASPAAASAFKIVVLGDSLTAGYGVAADAAFPARLEAALRAKGHDVTVVNAGVSGDTAAQGLARLDWALAEGADAAIVELGANDALRGLDPAATRRSLTAILDALKTRGVPVLLAGMRAPPNMGEDYVDEFDSIYPDLARSHSAILYPFFLDGVVGARGLNLEDGIHPNANGIEEIVQRILPKVEELLETPRSTSKQSSAP
jgi:acyl-CoA thioesterase I